MKRRALVFFPLLISPLYAADVSTLPGMAPKSALGSSSKAVDVCKKEYENHKKKIAAKPDDLQAWQEFRICTSELKRWGEAIQVANDALEKGDYAPARLVRGIAAMHQKDYEKAANDFSEAIHLKPDEGMPYYYLGMAQLYLGKPQEASEAATKAVELDPKNPGYHAQLAYTALLTDDREKAEAEAQKALELDKNNVAAWKVLGNLYKKQGRQQESAHAFEQAMQASGRLAGVTPAVPKRPLPVASAEVPPPAPAPEDEKEDSKELVIDQCRKQWDRMRAALEIGDIDRGITYYSDYLDTRQQYRTSFDQLGVDRVKAIFSGFGEVRDCSVVLLSAVCKATLTTSHNGEIRSIEQTVRFERNSDRVWRIRSF